MKPVIAMLLTLLLLAPGAALAHGDHDDDDDDGPGPGGFRCPRGRQNRTPEQVWAARIAALSVGNIDLAMCDYARNATVVMPGSVLTGRAQIKAGFLAFAQLVNFAQPEVTSTTFAGPILLVTFTLITNGPSIPDGADTFVIRNGLIHQHVVHASITGAGP
jgi:hypothetical protein